MTEWKNYNQTGSQRMDHFMLVHNFNEDLKINALKRDIDNKIVPMQTISKTLKQVIFFFFQGLCCHKLKLANQMCLFHMEIITASDKSSHLMYFYCWKRVVDV